MEFTTIFYLEIYCIVNSGIAIVINKFILTYHLPYLYIPMHIIK